MLIAVLLRPFPNTPFIDDWVYSWPVEHLLETGELLFPEYSTSPLVTQVLWGALFSLPVGFSLSALRVSGWALAILAIWAMYFLALELGSSRRGALVGAASIAFYPVFFILAPTFMTDVPHLAGMLWATLLFIRALGRRSDRLVWLAAAVCAASVGSRVIGVGVACAMLATLLFHTGRWGRRVAVLLPPLLVVPFTFLLLLWSQGRLFVSADMTYVGGAQNRLEDLRYALPILPEMLVVTALFVAALVGVALLPLAVGSLSRRVLKRAARVLPVVIALWIVALWVDLDLWIPLAPGETWAIGELGATAPLVPEWDQPSWPVGVEQLLLAMGLCLGCVVLAAAWPPSPLRAAEKFIWWVIAGQFMLSAILWLGYDRYGLVFVPLIAALMVARISRTFLVNIPVTVGGLLLYAAISLAGTHDHLEYNRALWRGVDDLRARGVPVALIDGGYVVNGRLQYLHPDQANRGSDGRIAIPGVNESVNLKYRLPTGRRRTHKSLGRTPTQAGCEPMGNCMCSNADSPTRAVRGSGGRAAGGRRFQRSGFREQQIRHYVRGAHHHFFPVYRVRLPRLPPRASGAEPCLNRSTRPPGREPRQRGRRSRGRCAWRLRPPALAF